MTDYGKKQLYKQMMAYAGAMGYITDQQMKDTVTRHGIMVELVKKFESVYQPIADFPGEAAVMEAWERYLTPKEGDHGSNDNIQTITLNVTVHYGTVSIGIGISDEFIVRNASDRQAILRMLREQIDDLHREQARSVHQAAPKQAAEPTGDTVRIEVTALRKENSQGKDRMRVIGGKWSQHGVPLYAEAAQAADVDMEFMAYGDTAVKGHATVQLRPNGNPLKVLELEL